MNHKHWILLPLLSAGFALTILVCASHAALLKDIRVGEYSGFTRIVFELDAPAVSEKIEPQPAKRLAVIFANTSADLIRKIPLKRSPHVKDIQIWEKDNRLRALLTFDFDNFRHKSFSLIDPPRLVLDIHPTANAPDTDAASPPATMPDVENGFSQRASTRGSEPAPLQRDVILGEPVSRNQEPPPKEANKPPQSVTVNKDQSSAMPPRSTTRPSDARPSRLQYYLVIVLVSITIIILVLLLLMLMVRHRWIEDRSRLVAKKAPESSKKI